MATTEVGHAPNRVYMDADGNLHMNGGKIYSDEAGSELAGSEIALLDGLTAGTAAVSKALTLDAGGDITWVDGGEIDTGSTTGLTIATAVTEKVGFWGVTPVVQPAAAGQADQGAMTFAAGAIDTGTDMTAAEAAALVADIAALDTLLTEVRTALVNVGIMKGAA